MIANCSFSPHQSNHHHYLCLGTPPHHLQCHYHCCNPLQSSICHSNTNQQHLRGRLSFCFLSAVVGKAQLTRFGAPACLKSLSWSPRQTPQSFMTSSLLRRSAKPANRSALSLAVLLCFCFWAVFFFAWQISQNSTISFLRCFSFPRDLQASMHRY